MSYHGLNDASVNIPLFSWRPAQLMSAPASTCLLCTDSRDSELEISDLEWRAILMIPNSYVPRLQSLPSIANLAMDKPPHFASGITIPDAPAVPRGAWLCPGKGLYPRGAPLITTAPEEGSRWAYKEDEIISLWTQILKIFLRCGYVEVDDIVFPPAGTGRHAGMNTAYIRDELGVNERVISLLERLPCVFKNEQYTQRRRSSPLWYSQRQCLSTLWTGIRECWQRAARPTPPSRGDPKAKRQTGASGPTTWSCSPPSRGMGCPGSSIPEQVGSNLPSLRPVGRTGPRALHNADPDPTTKRRDEDFLRRLVVL